MGKTFWKINKHTLTIIVGLSVFVGLSVLYDWWVKDRTFRRTATLIGALLIVLGSLFLRIINIKKIKEIFTHQMGV